jgi:hypothetical protein
MKTVYNRFALIPFHCTDCHRYIWLEKYRKASVYKSVSLSVPSFTTRKICNECLKKYNITEVNGN